MVKIFDYLFLFIPVQLENVTVRELAGVVSHSLINLSCLHSIQLCHVSVNQNWLLSQYYHTSLDVLWGYRWHCILLILHYITHNMNWFQARDTGQRGQVSVLRTKCGESLLFQYLSGAPVDEARLHSLFNSKNISFL